MKAHIKLGRIFGVAIGLHYSWIIIALLVTLSLRAQFAMEHPNWGGSTTWSIAIITGLLFFVSILLHELSHAAVAKREFTGVGFFTEFTLPADAPVSRDLPDETIGGVGASFPGVEHGAGFLLFIRSGVVTMLEGYTYADDQWPESTDEFQVFKTAA